METRSASRIFLIGFMGSGKTTIGKKLAALLPGKFIDLDDVIEEQEAMTISKIFVERGEEYFREIEASCLRGLQMEEHIVVATGGGTPCFHNNMEWMKQQGLTIYLRVRPQVLADRLEKEKEHRPLLQGKSGEDLILFISQKLMEREPFYLQSEVVAEGGNLTAEALHRQVTGVV
jgi:shikimate kinase